MNASTRGKQTRADILRLGSYGKTVRVVEVDVRSVPKYRVLWYEESNPRQKDFPRNREGKSSAKAFAEAFWVLRENVVEASPETVRSIWLAFTRSDDFRFLSDRTQFLYSQSYGRWENFVGPNTLVAGLAHTHMNDFRQSRQSKRKSGAARSLNQVRKDVSVIGLVCRWAKRNKLVKEDPFDGYRIPTRKGEKQQEAPGEFTPQEFEAILAVLSPQDPYKWRASAALLLIGETGARISAAVQLKWFDVHIAGAGGHISWPAETSKQRRRFDQPLTPGGLSALLTAKYWRDRRGMSSEYVFPTAQPSRRSAGYLTRSALLSALARAEARAQVPHQPLRGAHGLRRMIATSIATKTGNVVAAMQWLGDRDYRQARSYLKERGSVMEETAAVVAVLGSSGVSVSKASQKTGSARVPLSDESS